MRFPPLLLSSHTSSWGGAACRERRATKVDPAPVPDIPCRFCGALAAGRQEWFHLNGDEADAAPGNLAVACTLCHLTQHLDTAAAEGSATLIWLPEMSQQALFAVARAAQLSLLEAGDDPTLDTLPRRESPATIAAWRALTAFRARQAICASKLLTHDPAVLGAALLGLAPRAYQDRAYLLGGVRLLPLGRMPRGKEDIYPDLLRAWGAPRMIHHRPEAA